jgi:threonine/homoserine/homoserine lactone efflux protein
MPVTLFIRGFLIGLSVAAAIGPMAILCIRRTLAQGYLAGLATGLGVATADGCYGAVAGFGLVLISQFLVAQHVWLRLIGGIFLCYLGLKTLLAVPATRAANASGGDLARFYLSALGLTLTNPLTILSFAAIFAGLGVDTGGGYGGAGLLVLGVFIGSALWWVVLTGAVTALRGRITPRVLRWVNRTSGTLISAFGLLALAGLR